jgi:hypothetical protein
MKPIHADKVLQQMAKTFKVKNKKYGDNYLNVGKVLKALFPRGITLKTEYDQVLFHWISWKVGKFTRFIQTGMTHLDSIHDDSVYGAMIEDWVRTNKPRKKTKNGNTKKRKH